MTKQERREFYHQLFMANRFIPKLEALAKASDTCLVCSVPFAAHPRNHHATDEQISAGDICVGCGTALVVKVTDRDAPITMSNLEYVPCQFCFRGVPASHFPSKAVYAFTM